MILTDIAVFLVLCQARECVVRIRFILNPVNTGSELLLILLVIFIMVMGYYNSLFKTQHKSLEYDVY